MQSINSLSHAPAVNTWLANSRQPRILHIFNRTCNLINERREVLSIVTEQIGKGPFNLVLEDDYCFTEHLDLQSPVSNSSHVLTLGDLTIHTADAKLWNPHPNWKRLHARRDDIFNQIMLLRGQWFSTRSNPLDNWEIASSQSALLETTSSQLPIIDYPKCGLDTPNAKTTQGYSTTDVSQPSISTSLVSALATADLPSSLIATQKLAGLGIGLTPSGDDIIMGAIYAAWIIHPPQIASVLAKEIADTAAPLTTSLSAAWLRSAGRGEAGILWHDLFDALITGGSIELPIAKLLSVGETSGADALAGFIGVCLAFRERIIGECPS